MNAGKPLFIVLELRGATPEQVQCLTAHIMHWQDDVWLMDLASVWSYWRRQAARARLEVTLLWKQVLQASITPETKKTGVISLQSHYRAVVGSHPWHALLLLQRMRERRLTGFLNQRSETAAQLWRDISWDLWWETADAVAAHWEEGHVKGFRGSRFRQEKAKFIRAVGRLNLHRPADMQHVGVEEMNRRFGGWWGELWRWTWQGSERDELFPWQNWCYPEPPQVTRHLDEALVHWRQIESLLREDFDRLNTRLTERHRVQVLCWDWVRSDMSKDRVLIKFRHPHSLHQERGEQQTALLQAFYQFEDSQRQQSHLEEEGIVPPHLVSWSLSVGQSLILVPMLQDLFGDMNEEQEGEQALSRLENELPIPLQRFDYSADWLPEKSFVPLGLGVQNVSRAAYQAAARRRPLFIYRSPQPLNMSVRRYQFLECVGEHWWDGGAALERQYFRITTSQSQDYWAYRDTKGAWWVHGVFA